MKCKYVLIFAIFNVVAVNKHIKKCTVDQWEKRYNGRYEVCSKNSDFIIVNGCHIHRKVVLFKEIEPISVQDFLQSILNNYYCGEDCSAMKKLLLSQSPREVWLSLQNRDLFGAIFVDYFQKAYSEEEFILIYEVHLAIEWIIYVLDTSSTVTYPYSYGNKIQLKEIMTKLLFFVKKNNHLFEEILSEKDMTALLAFLEKYTKVKNNLIFLNELSSLSDGILVNIGFRSNNPKKLGTMAKLHMVNNFNRHFV